MSSEVRVRFAPSPTGHLHIGGARTALFNWFFARHHKGTFVLRIEDTDLTRSTQESIDGIIEGLSWLGVDWDEGPYRQQERVPLYREHAERLLKEGKAYYCYCTPEELEEKRKRALAAGAKPKYDGTCRERTSPVPGRKAAVRFRAPQEGSTVVHDLIRGDVVFENKELDDLIILRSDGSPTYNFTVVVDDVTMRISHVIRGDDHLANTPRQILLYQALGYPLPGFGHISLILGTDKARLSKRHGATSVVAYRDMGYLPEAMVNYLVRLGWSLGDQEIFSREEIIEHFSLEKVTLSAAVFNPEKLLWLNGHYISKTSPQHLADLLPPFLAREGIAPDHLNGDRESLVRRIQTLQERAKTLAEIAEKGKFYFVDEVELDPAAVHKFLTPDKAPLFLELKARLEPLAEFSADRVREIFEKLLAERGLKLKDLAQPVRVALTGGTVSPGIYEVIENLGKDKTLSRLARALELMQGNPNR